MDFLCQIRNGATVLMITYGWHTNHELELIDVILKNGIKLRLHLKSLPVR